MTSAAERLEKLLPLVDDVIDAAEILPHPKKHPEWRYFTSVDEDLNAVHAAAAAARAELERWKP